MANYHIFAGPFGIYAGKTNKNGTEWLDKSEVTNEALLAVTDYFLKEMQINNKTEAGYEQNYKDDKVIELLVRIKGGETNV